MSVPQRKAPAGVGSSRAWPRIDVALSVAVRFQNRDELTATRTLNVSRTGLFIALPWPRPIGTPVLISISIASTGERFSLEGVVVHCQPADDGPLAPAAIAGVGVFLTHASPEYEQLCDELAASAAQERQARRRVRRVPQ
jgi:Tfp pilus assembly protein PilZ